MSSNICVDSIVITLFTAFSLLLLLLRTEYLSDESIVSASPMLASSLLVVVVFVLLWYTFVRQYSPLICTLAVLYLVSTTVYLYLSRNKVQFYTVDSETALVLKNGRVNDLPDGRSINVCLYEDCSLTNTSGQSLDQNNISRLKKILLERIAMAYKSRKSEDELLVLVEDFKYLYPKSFKDVKLFTEMLNSIYFTKLQKNLVILLRAFDIDNLESNGFSRPVKQLKLQHMRTKESEEKKLSEPENCSMDTSRENDAKRLTNAVLINETPEFEEIKSNENVINKDLNPPEELYVERHEDYEDFNSFHHISNSTFDDGYVSGNLTCDTLNLEDCENLPDDFDFREFEDGLKKQGYDPLTKFAPLKSQNDIDLNYLVFEDGLKQRGSKPCTSTPTEETSLEDSFLIPIKKSRID